MSVDRLGGGPGDVLAALRGGRIEGEDARLRAATELLEGSFYQELFKAMRDTVPEGGVVSGGFGQGVFEGMLDQSVAESAALGADGGLAEALFRYFRGYDAASTDGAGKGQP
jgi:flagellar protein FlgJ